MKILWPGVGSAFAPAGVWNCQAVVVAESGKKLLIDCGRDAQHSLASVGLEAKDVDAVYISHLHGDHVYGLEWLAFCRYGWSGPVERPKLYGVDLVMTKLWAQVMRGTLESITNKTNTFADYFDIRLLDQHDSFMWEGITFKPVRTHHIHDGQRSIPSFGLMIMQESGYKVFVTSDTQLSKPHLEASYAEADVIFHDCETTENKSGVHAHFTELAELPESVKSKMHLVHYQSGAKYHSQYEAAWHGFQGFVNPRAGFEFGGL